MKTLSDLKTRTINLALLVFLTNLELPAFSKSQNSLAVSRVEENASQFMAASTSLGESDDCVPVHTGMQSDISIFQLYCSPPARIRDSKPFTISGSFTVSDILAPRFNFWRRIYSLWSSDQYVLHVGEYPEIVLEIADVSQVKGSNLEKTRVLKRVLAKHRQEYTQLLRSMHKAQKIDRSKWTPAMLQMDANFAHISASDKYLRAADSLRVQRGQRDFIASGLAVSNRYMDAIRSEFIAEGIPVELSNLAFIESSFNIEAYSKVGAAGIYQIMPETGRQYMKVNDLIDERRDPIKSARAAAKLLRLYYNLLGAWPLAITGYNHGVGGIRTAMRATGSSNIDTLIQKYDGKAFGFASKNFYTGFLALLWSLENADRVFPDVKRESPMLFTEVRLPKDMSIVAIQKKFTMTAQNVNKLNPEITWKHIRSNSVLPAGFEIKIPKVETYTVEASAQLNP